MLFRRNLTLTAWSTYIINGGILFLLLSKFIGRAVGYSWAVRSVYIVNYNIIAFAPFGVYLTSLYTIVPSSFILRGGDACIPVLR